MNKYIIEKSGGRVLSFLLDEAGHAVEIHADSCADGPKLGDIYIGLVQKVARNVNAAFVEIIPGVSGYLPFDEIVQPIFTLKGPSAEIQEGDQLVVQIVRDAFGDKGMSLSTKLTWKGRYLILTYGGIGLGISRKIPEEARQNLKEKVFTESIFAKLKRKTGQSGIVVRTQAMQEETGDKILEELSLFEAELSDILLKAPYRTVYSNLKKQPPRWMSRILESSPEETQAVITDDPGLFRQMKMHEGYFPENVRFYDDQMVSMEKVYSLERELQRAQNKHVDLKSGASLIIQTTEALHVIDVNSSRSKGKQKEEALLKVNLEAAEEAARQIRLRNLSGIIIIDFINLIEAKHSLSVIEALRAAVSKDPVRTRVVDMTKLGLVELTRQKIEVPLRDQLSALHQLP